MTYESEAATIGMLISLSCCYGYGMYRFAAKEDSSFDPVYPLARRWHGAFGFGSVPQ